MNKAHSFKAPALLAGAMTGFTVLSGVLLSASASFAANTGNLETTVNVAAACSLTVSPSSHAATINPGTTGSIGTSTVKSICNDPAGLAVYAVGYTDDTYGNNKLTATIAGNTYDISSNYTSSGTPLSSEWYMTLTPTTGTYTPSITTGFDSAHAVPSVYTKVAYRNAMTDIGENATGAQFTAAFNAYISLAQPAGSYTGKVKFLLIHPNVLTYDSQTGEPATVQPATLPCEPVEAVHYDTFDTSVTHYLQDIASWKNQVALNQEVTAYDRRDNQAYKVKRLKMGSNGCQTAIWMTENLRLDFTNPTLTSKTDSELESMTHSPASGFFTAAKGAAASNSGFDSNNYDTVKYSNINIGDTTVDSTGHTYDEYGIYYNWYTATAGHGTQNGITSGSVTGDICPKGWYLPTNASFNALNTAINNDSTIDPSGLIVNANFLYSGYYNGSTIYGCSTNGCYWSSTAYSSGDAYHLHFGSSFVRAGSNFNYKYTGRSVRCLADS